MKMCIRLRGLPSNPKMFIAMKMCTRLRSPLQCCEPLSFDLLYKREPMGKEGRETSGEEQGRMAKKRYGGRRGDDEGRILRGHGDECSLRSGDRGRRKKNAEQ